MIDAYAIGASLTLDDKIFGQLQQVSDKFDVVQQAIDKINGSLKETVGLVGQASSSANSMASAFERAATAAERMQRAAGSGLVSGAIGGYAPPGVGQAGGAAVPMQFDHTASPGMQLPFYDSTNLPAVIPGQGRYGYGGPERWGWTPIKGYGEGGTPAGGDGGGGGGSPPNFTMPPSAGGPDAPFNDPNAPGRSGGAGAGGGPLHLMSSIFIAQAGYDVATGAAKAFTAPSFDLQQQELNLRNMGATPPEVQQAMAQAIAIQRQTPGISIGQAMAMIANLFVVDRDMKTVSAIAPGYARDAFVASNAQGGANVIDEMYQVLRSGEEAGKLNLLDKNKHLDPSKLVSFMDMIVRMVANSNGNITGEGMLRLAGQAGPGFTQMSDTAIQRAILASQALGTSQVGIGLNAMYQEFIGGKMSQGTARSLHDAGMLPDSMFGPDDKILKKYRYGIGYAMLPPGALKNEPQALTDPMQWSTENLFGKYLDADGIVKTGDEKMVQELIGNLNRDFSRIPGMRLAGNALFNTAAFNRQLTYLDNGTVPSVGQMAANDATGANNQAKGTGAAFNAFLQALGSPLIPGATAGLSMLTKALNSASSELRAHPDETMAGEGVVATVLGYLGIKYGGRAAGALARKVGLTGARGAAGEAESVSGLEIGAAGAATGGVLSGGLGLAGLLYLGWKQVEGMGDLPLPFTKGAAAYNQKIKDGPTGAPDQPLSVRISNLPAFLSALAAHQGQEAAQMPSSPTGFNLSGSAPPAPGQPLGVR